MPDSPEQIDAMFPTLDDAQMAQLRAFGEPRSVRREEVLFEPGDASHGVLVVIEGSIEIAGLASGEEAETRVLRRGAFTGEVNQLSGRRALVRCRALEASLHFSQSLIDPPGFAPWRNLRCGSAGNRHTPVQRV